MLVLHFICTHPWEVRDVEDCVLVTLTGRDLDPTTVATLADDLLEQVRESGRPNLHIDLADIHTLPSIVLGKMVALQARLRQHNGRLILSNLNPVVQDTLYATQLLDLT